MANNARPLRDYAVPSEEEPHSSIAPPNTEARNFELKPALLQIVQQNQFSGSPTEDPNLHLSVFVQYADTIKANGVEPEAIRLRLFPFSLRDRARAWLQALPSNSITTWNELKKQFLARYFPPSKTAMLRAQINGFRQKDGESLFEAWERYKDMMRLCPHHGLEQWLIIHTFYNGLLYNTRLTIDAAAGGALMDKPYQEATQLIENMAQNHYQWGSERAAIEKSQTKGGMYEVSGIDHVNAKVEALTQKLESLTLPTTSTVAAIQPNCEVCGVPGHVPSDCAILAGLDQVHYAALSNNYNPGYKNHPNLSYRNNNTLNPTQAPPATKVDALATHNKMLETQISQVAQQQATIAAPAGTFPGQPEPNPKGHANAIHAIITRSGKELQGPPDSGVKNSESAKITNKEAESSEPPKEPEKESENPQLGDKEGTTKKLTPAAPPVYKTPIPFPQRLAKTKTEGHFKKFVELLKQLNITIPFSEAITQMPTYSKFLKEILSNKRKLDEDSNYVIDKALCDLGASVSLMPLSISKKLNLSDLKPTRMSLQLADRSVKYPVGILENIPVKIGQLYIPTDFVVMDITEDSCIPILFGRPFLATAGAIIDVKRGKLTLEVGEEKIEFILSKFMQTPAVEDTCYAIDIIDECVKEIEKELPKEAEILKHPIDIDNSLTEDPPLGPNSTLEPKQLSLELKPLPKNLRYEYLDENMSRPVIVNADLDPIETEKLLDVLRKYPSALGYNISDLKGI
ncbi:unnamed protein product, partial [Trifolium pratense]